MYALLIQGLSTKVSNAKLTRCVIFTLHVGNTVLSTYVNSG